MTLDEIQREIVTLSDDERVRLRAFLLHLSRVDTAENRAELSRLKAGNFVSTEEVEKAHSDLLAQGC